MKSYSVTFQEGQTIVTAESADAAKRFAYAQFGRQSAPFTVEEATDEDICWVEVMGGRIYGA